MSNLHKKLIEEDIEKSQDVEIRSNQNNTYSTNVRQTVIELMSEAGVSADKCDRAIRIISKNLFNHNITEKLPCRQSCSNMSAEGLVISDIQATEKVLNSDSVIFIWMERPEIIKKLLAINLVVKMAQFFI